MPSAPCAWAATRRPARVASSTPARSSSGVSCVAPGEVPGVSTPPVAINLMTSAPARICSRTACTTSAGPSAWRPMNQACPPGMQIARPALSVRGPGMIPALIARATEIEM